MDVFNYGNPFPPMKKKTKKQLRVVSPNYDFITIARL